MTMTEPIEGKPATPWQGDWKARLQEKLSMLGFDNLEKFLADNPGLGYSRLAKCLGDSNVAAMQLYSEQIRRGFQTDNIRCVAMDSLVRFLNEYLTRGWKNGRHFQHRSTSAFATWHTAITALAGSDTAIERKLTKVFDSLEAMAIPGGWLPKDKNDIFVVAAFEKGWPIAEKT